MNAEPTPPEATAGAAAPASLTLCCVIPVRNGAATLARALQSLGAQSVPLDDIVVVDDGSTDDTVAIAQKSAGVRVVPNAGTGVSAARNTGVGLSDTTVVTFLDADDEVSPRWAAALRQRFVERNDVGVVCCGVTFKRGGEVTGVQLPGVLGPENHGLPGLYLAGTFAVRRDLFDAAGGYAEALAYSENTELSYRLADQLQSRSLHTSCVNDGLVIVHTSVSEARFSRYREARLRGAEYFLGEHSTRLARRPEALATYAAIGGLAAAQLQDFATARRLYRRAVRVQPLNPRHWLRLATVLCAPVARRVYRRHDRADATSTR